MAHNTRVASSSNDPTVPHANWALAKALDDLLVAVQRLKDAPDDAERRPYQVPRGHHWSGTTLLYGLHRHALETVEDLIRSLEKNRGAIVDVSAIRNDLTADGLLLALRTFKGVLNPAQLMPVWRPLRFPQRRDLEIDIPPFVEPPIEPVGICELQDQLDRYVFQRLQRGSSAEQVPRCEDYQRLRRALKRAKSRHARAFHEWSKKTPFLSIEERESTVAAKDRWAHEVEGCERAEELIRTMRDAMRTVVAKGCPMIRVDIEGIAAIVAGKRIPLKSKRQAEILSSIIKADGGWITGKDIAVVADERVDRFLAKLPPEVNQLIERKPGSGYRLRP